VTWIIVLAVLLVIFLAIAWLTDRRHKSPREPRTAFPFDPSNVRDKAVNDRFWKGESPLRPPRKNSGPPPKY
jgi:hypothetical protein